LNGLIISSFVGLYFFFTATAPPQISTLSLHDALPISPPRPDHLCTVIRPASERDFRCARVGSAGRRDSQLACGQDSAASKLRIRSEEHTSELQSQSNLVCRLLLEKKKKKENNTTNNYH